MMAARVASPEGWQVSVRCWLNGVGQAVPANWAWVYRALAVGEGAGERVLGQFLGVALRDCRRGRGERC